MANSESINTLLLKVRQRSDQLNSSTFDDVTELKPMLRDSLAQLYEVMVAHWQDYYVIYRPVSFAAGQQSYALPSNFRAMCDVYQLVGGGGTTRIRLSTGTPENWALGNQLTYRIQSSRLYIYPIPSIDAINALELAYVPQYSGPLLDYTTIDEILPNGWQEWVIMDVLLKMNDKTRLMNGDDLQKNRSAVQSRLLTFVLGRDGNGQQMTDVYNGTYQTLDPYVTIQGPAIWISP